MNLNGTILLVEDSSDDVLLTKIALAKARLGNPLNVVGDGEEAMAYLDGNEEYSDREQFPFPILVLLDLKLPKINGFEVLKWVGQQAFRDRLMIAVMTDSESEPDVKLAYRLGADSYLVKPPDAETLFQLVRRLKAFWFISGQRQAA